MEWQSLSPREAFEALKSDPQQGLSHAMIQKNRALFGRNQLPEEKRDGILKRFFSQFADFMVLLLLAAAGISFGVSYFGHDGNYTDSVIILIIVFLNALIGTVQESKAEHALKALKKLSAPHARVIREGIAELVDAADLVPGDLVLLEAGDLIPADIRLSEAVNMLCEESSLTGESNAVPKNASRILPPQTPLGDQTNMLFMGCTVSSGHGRGIVTAIGTDTQIGRIAGMIRQEKAP